MEPVRDRKRKRHYVPSSEPLEDRALQTNYGFPGLGYYNNINPQTELPHTYQTKIQRIDRLPFFFDQFERGRYLPSSVVAPIQNDLISIAATLQPASSNTLVAFNKQIRTTIAHASVTPKDATGLVDTFTKAVATTGTPPSTVASLRQDITNLIKLDVASPETTLLATSDTSLVLQTLLGVGQPISTPGAPSLSLKDGTRAKGKKGISHTGQSQPILVGTYADAVGKTQLPVTMQILDTAGNVIGAAPVNNKNGDYSARVAVPLAPGLYSLRVRAVDARGHMSNPSPGLALQVVAKPHKALVQLGQAVPAGPLGTITGR